MPRKPSVEKLDESTLTWTHIKAEHAEYLVTSDALRTEYTLYKLVFDNSGNVTGYEKIGTGTDPLQLENKYIWRR